MVDSGTEKGREGRCAIDILLVAPANPSLPGLDAEIAAISSHHDVTLLAGIVREVDIADAISAHPEGFAILWWATHGSDLGVQITGEVLTADGVGQYISASRARLCVLNTCASEALARQIIVGTDCDIVFTVADLADQDALRFGSLFAGELAKTDNYRKAFDLASPKRGRYRYLPAKAAIRNLDMTVSSELQKLGSRVDEGVKSYQEVQRGFYQMTVDAKADRLSVTRLEVSIATLQQQFEILRQQAQSQVMREDLRKEGLGRDIAAIGQRMDSQSAAPLATSVAPPVPVKVAAMSPTLIALVALIAIIVILGVFYAGRVF